MIKKNIQCLVLLMSLGMALEGMAAIIFTSNDFDTGIGSWVHVGTVTSGTIAWDDISAYDGTPGDGLVNDGGLVLNSANGTQGDEAMGLTISGTMEVGEEVTFSGNWYNDNSSYSKNNAQLWNLTDGTLLAESGSTHVDPQGTPVAFSVSYTAMASDDGDTLQVRFREDNNHTARDIYVDNFSLTSSLGPPVVYNHPRLFFSTNEMAEVKARRLTTHSDEWSQLISTCDNLVGTSPTTTPRTDGGSLLDYEEKLTALAVAQFVDPSLPYYTTGTNWFWTIMNWTEWGPGYWSWPDYGPKGNLATGEILRALAIWYDLHYHNFTFSERIDISTRLADYADRYRNSYSRFWTTDNGELTGNHCWNAFAAVAAVLYASDDVSPARQTDWSNLFNGHYNTISNLMSGVMSDGATGEGFTYWTYGIEKILLWYEMRRVAGDTAFDGIDWFENTGTYGIFGIMPGGTDNYGGVSRYDDANHDYWGNPYNELSLLAKATQDPVAQWMANELDHDGENKKNAYRYLFYDASLASADPHTDLNNWHFFDDYGLFFWRNSWSNNAQHFTLRSGQHSHGHSKGDDGQFMLSRSGIPYIANLGYAKPRYSRDCNVLQVDGTGQYSDGADWGTVFNASWPDNTNTWGKTLHALANDTYYQKGDFFNMLVDPTQMYTNPVLTSWQREVVGLGGDLYLLRDAVSASSSADFDLLLHGVVTSASGDTYSENSTSNPWTSTGAGTWELNVRSGNPKLKVQDLSDATWSSSIEETWYYPKNSVLTRRGNKLKRSFTGSAETSLVSLGFDDLMSGWTQTAWTNGSAEGVHIVASGSPVIDVLWPLNGVSVSSSDGWNVTGKMSGRRFGDSFFGRDVSAIQYNGLSLLNATTPVSFHAKTEFPLGGTVPGRIIISAAAASSVTVYSPYQPESVLLDNVAVAFSWTNNQLTLTIPATERSIVDLVDGRYLAWRDQHFSAAEISAGDAVLGNDADTDGPDNWYEFMADTDPLDTNSYWQIMAANGAFSYGTSTARLYTVEYATNLVGASWQILSQDNPGTGSDVSISDTNNLDNCFYRVKTALP
jgi:hypothetical protein